MFTVIVTQTRQFFNTFSNMYKQVTTFSRTNHCVLRCARLIDKYATHFRTTASTLFSHISHVTCRSYAHIAFSHVPQRSLRSSL